MVYRQYLITMAEATMSYALPHVFDNLVPRGAILCPLLCNDLSSDLGRFLLSHFFCIKIW